MHDRQRFLRHSAQDITTKHYDPDTRKARTMTKQVSMLMAGLDGLITRAPEGISPPGQVEDSMR